MLVGMVELGRTGLGTLMRLIQGGAQNFILADSRPFLVADFNGLNSLFGPKTPALSPRRAECIGLPRNQVIQGYLHEVAPQVRTAAQPGPEIGFGWEYHWLADCDVCVLACDVSLPRVVWDVNSACLRLRVPLVPGLVMGGAGQVGPWVGAAASGACLRCLDLRIRATLGRDSLVEASPTVSACEQVALGLATEVECFAADPTASPLANRVRYLGDRGGEHAVLRTAHCPDCGQLGPFMPYRFANHLQLCQRPVPESPPVLELRTSLVDPVTGPIRELRRIPEASPVEQWLALSTDLGPALAGIRDMPCGGCDLSKDAALAAALGEAVERASTQPVRKDDRVVGSYLEMEDDAVDPVTWDLFDERTRSISGFPYHRVTRDRPISWVWAYSLGDRVPVLVPATRVFVPQTPIFPDELTDYPILSGFAAGDTLESAILSAIYEVAERDAFMLAWATRLPVKRLCVDRQTPGKVGRYLSVLEDSEAEVRCFVLQLDLGIPCVFALGRSERPEDGACFLGAAADPDIELACTRALKELIATRQYVRHVLASPGNRLPEKEEAVSMEDHVMLYSRPEMARHLDMWWQTDERVALKDLAGSVSEDSDFARLETCVETIRAAGLQILIVDLTLPEMGELGLQVVKALIPGTYPINFDSRWPHFGGSRMSQVPVDLGLLREPVSFEQLNRIPHPFG